MPIPSVLEATGSPRKRVGVLALQGDYDAHSKAVDAAGGQSVLVRTPEAISAVEALILPGGESTTIGKLMRRYGIDEAIRSAHAAGMPLFGTCAGMILLSRFIVEGEMRGGQLTLGLMDVDVVRNAFGRQADSFEADIDAPEVVAATDESSDVVKPGGRQSTVRGVFIRAPIVTAFDPDVRVLARYDDKVVLVRQGRVLASSFHPELTGDTRVHRYFLQMIP